MFNALETQDINGISMMDQQKNEFLVTIDDDPIVNAVVEKSTGLQSYKFGNTSELFLHNFDNEPLAVFLDIHLANGENGLDSIPKIRQRWIRAPIIVLTSDDNAEMIVNALSGGANDFIRKPIHPLEITARLKARLQEQLQKNLEEDLAFHDLKLNARRRFLECKTSTSYLSPTESMLLETLMVSKGMIVKRFELKRKIWGNIHVSDNALDRKVFEVRTALKDMQSNVTISSQYGIGFCLKIVDKNGN